MTDQKTPHAYMRVPLERKVSRRWCECGKRIFKSVNRAKFNAKKLQADVPMWVYECHKATKKGIFHITRSKGNAAMKIEAANDKIEQPTTKTLEQTQ